MSEKVKNILLGIVIGDALGTPVSGMSKKHIASNFKNIQGYIDPAPGLKDKMDKWKKPGLYSSITQLMLLVFMVSDKNRLSYYSLKKNTNKIHDIENSDLLFRNPSQVEKYFITGLFDDKNKTDLPYFSCAQILTVSLPIILMKKNNIDLITEIISFTNNFTKDMITVSGMLLYSHILKQGLTSTLQRDNLLDISIDSCDSIMDEIKLNSGKIFEAKINPDDLATSFSYFAQLIKKLKTAKNTKDTSDSIITTLNSIQKSPVSRPTIDNPLAILPYSIYTVNDISVDTEHLLFETAVQGGSASILTAITGSLLGITEECLFPQELINGLINKNNIQKIIEGISRGKSSALTADDFLKNEISMSKKEYDELQAKLKNTKTKKNPKKSDSDKKKNENELNRHVVESWTKADRARWKKERNKLNKNNI